MVHCSKQFLASYWGVRHSSKDRVLELDLNLQKELITAITAALKGSKSWVDSPAVIALVSGAMAILAAILTNLFNTRSEQARHDSEIKLKEIDSKNAQQEKIREKQLDSLNCVAKILHDLTPLIWSDPSFDSYDAYSSIVLEMDGLRTELSTYLREHSYITPDEIITHINDVIYLCNDNCWQVIVESGPEYETSVKECDAAKDILDKLKLSVREFKIKLGITNA